MQEQPAQSTHHYPHLIPVIDSSAVTAAPDITEIEPNVDVPEAFANVIIEEQAHISI